MKHYLHSNIEGTIIHKGKDYEYTLLASAELCIDAQDYENPSYESFEVTLIESLEVFFCDIDKEKRLQVKGILKADIEEALYEELTQDDFNN
jgi:hypothetical protein